MLGLSVLGLGTFTNFILMITLALFVCYISVIGLEKVKGIRRKEKLLTKVEEKYESLRK
jgi:hypothetical protein